MIDKKLESFNETAISSFNRIKQKHGFINVVELIVQGAKANENLQKIDTEKIQKVANEPIPTFDESVKEIVNADRVFDIMRFIDEQNLPNRVKAALGILLSGERSEIGNAIKYLEEEIKND